jgi:GntR family transcriptional repressor for pyruvate dehydrogenase complex
MIKKPIENLSVTDAVTEKLESMIVEGTFKPGDTLPPERQLARDFAVSRASLRQALSVLEYRGLILSKQGGGNYVCDVVKKSFSDPLLDLIKRHHELKFQVIELRQTLECSAAFYAAKRATNEDRVIIRQRLNDLKATVPMKNPVEEARADLELHLAIADAAHNVPLSLMNINSEKLHGQHHEMVELVMEGDSEGARRVVREHLELIRDTFIKNALVSEPSNDETRAILNQL